MLRDRRCNPIRITFDFIHGVLVDLGSRYGRERAIVGYDDLMGVLEEQRSPVEAGDFLCLYTGFADLILEMGKKPDRNALSFSCAVVDGRNERLLRWITDTAIVAICADNFALEAYPANLGQGETYPDLPLHNHCLFKLGVHLGELWYFADLARWLRIRVSLDEQFGRPSPAMKFSGRSRRCQPPQREAIFLSLIIHSCGLPGSTPLRQPAG